jgi:hypothetical protein
MEYSLAKPSGAGRGGSPSNGPLPRPQPCLELASLGIKKCRILLNLG